MSDIRTYFLPNGMEIIGVVALESATEVVLDKPLLVVYEPPAEGKQFSFGFAPFAPLSEGQKTLYKTALLGSGKPRQGLVNAYQQATGSVITPPSAAPGGPEVILLG